MTELDNLNLTAKVLAEASEYILARQKLEFELKFKIDFDTNEKLSEEYLNELPNRIKDLEEKELEIFKQSPEIMASIEHKKRLDKLLALIDEKPNLLEEILIRYN